MFHVSTVSQLSSQAGENSWEENDSALSLSFPCFSYLFVLVFNTNPPPLSLSYTLFPFPLFVQFPLSHFPPDNSCCALIGWVSGGGGTMWPVVIFSCQLRTNLSVTEETGTDALSHSVLSVKQHCYAFKKNIIVTYLFLDYHFHIPLTGKNRNTFLFLCLLLVF